MSKVDVRWGKSLVEDTAGSGSKAMVRASIGRAMAEHYGFDVGGINPKDVVAVKAVEFGSRMFVRKIFVYDVGGECYSGSSVPKVIKERAYWNSRMVLAQLSNILWGSEEAVEVDGSVLDMGVFSRSPVFLVNGWYYMEDNVLWFAPVGFDWTGLKCRSVVPVSSVMGYDMEEAGRVTRRYPEAGRQYGFRFVYGKVGEDGRYFSRHFGDYGQIGVSRLFYKCYLGGWLDRFFEGAWKKSGFGTLISSNLINSFGRGWKGEKTAAQLVSANKGEVKVDKIIEEVARFVGVRVRFDVRWGGDDCGEFSLVGGHRVFVLVDGGDRGGDDFWINNFGVMAKVMVRDFEVCLNGPVVTELSISDGTYRRLVYKFGEKVVDRAVAGVFEWFRLPILSVVKDNYCVTDGGKVMLWLLGGGQVKFVGGGYEVVRDGGERGYRLLNGGFVQGWFNGDTFE